MTKQNKTLSERIGRERVSGDYIKVRYVKQFIKDIKGLFDDGALILEEIDKLAGNDLINEKEVTK